MKDQLIEDIKEFVKSIKTIEDFPEKIKADYGYDREFQNKEPMFNPDGEDDFDIRYLNFIRDSGEE